MTIDHIGPVMRVYAAGAGSDKAQLGYLAEDLSLCLQSDPWPLREMTLSNTDTDKAEQLAALSTREPEREPAATHADQGRSQRERP